MDFKEYQEKAKHTAIYPKLDPSWIYPLLGITGESGELSERLKKILRDENKNISKEELELLKKEIGDILWYISALSTELGLDLDDIAKENMEKLQSRKSRNQIHGHGDNR